VTLDDVPKLPPITECAVQMKDNGIEFMEQETMGTEILVNGNDQSRDNESWQRILLQVP
jgi:hypothetical protein